MAHSSILTSPLLLSAPLSRSHTSSPSTSEQQKPLVHLTKVAEARPFCKMARGGKGNLIIMLLCTVVQSFEVSIKATKRAATTVTTVATTATKTATAQ